MHLESVFRWRLSAIKILLELDCSLNSAIRCLFVAVFCVMSVY